MDLSLLMTIFDSIIRKYLSYSSDIEIKDTNEFQ